MFGGKTDARVAVPREDPFPSKNIQIGRLTPSMGGFDRKRVFGTLANRQFFLSFLVGGR